MLRRFTRFPQHRSLGVVSLSAGFVRHAATFNYDEETRTTTVRGLRDTDNTNPDHDDGVTAEDVISASFGVQQNIRPSWSWAAHHQQQPPPQPEQEQQQNDACSDEVTASSSDNNNANDDFDILPMARRTTEVDARSTTDVDGNAVTDPDEAMRNEIAAEAKRGVPPVTSPQEDFMLEFQRYYYKHKTQVGAYIGSTPETEEKRRAANGGSGLALRQRREIERVPQYQPPFEAAETSFRRLPPSIRIPSERQLRFCYPMKTDLPIQWKQAHCADFNIADLESDAEPIRYGMLLPRNYDPRKEHPFLVWLSDHRGEEVDFEDSCAHLFARGPHYESWYENGWVIVSPVVCTRHSQMHPQEGVVARFCDWITANHRVEHGKVHLAGKGLGAFMAMQAVLNMKQLAISCTGLMGRLGGPYRPLERPQEKAHNINGTHVLMYVPGDMRKTDYVYKFKGFCDLAKVRPPVRAVHFADVRDHQLYYAVNSTEFWNYMEFFRRHPAGALTTTAASQ